MEFAFADGLTAKKALAPLKEFVCRIARSGRLAVAKTGAPVSRIIVAGGVSFKRWGNEMLSAIDKGAKAAELTRPPAGVYGDVDLRVIPKYVSYRAALLREKYGMQVIAGFLAMLWISTFLIQNNRIDYWQAKYREKEFILVPSTIVGHTPAVPQSVPQSYVENAAKYFLELLGNTTPTNIDEHYDRFSGYMSPELRARFMSETAAWRETSKSENIYEQIEITHMPWSADGSGGFDVEASIRRDRRVVGDFIGSTQEIIKMHLQLVPPTDDREWIFQIKEFSRRSASAHN